MTQVHETETTEATPMVDQPIDDATKVIADNEETTDDGEVTKEENPEEEKSTGRIRAEFLHATEITPSGDESDANLIKRLCKAVADDISDDAWNSLSTEAQEFANLVNDRVAKDNPKFPVPTSFPDEKTESSVEDQEPDRAPPVTNGKNKKTKKAKMAKEPKVAKEEVKPKKEPKASKAKTNPTKEAKEHNGIIHRAREIVVKNPKITTDELMTKLESEGLTGSRMAIGVTKQATISTMRIMSKAKMLKVELEL